MVSSRTVRLLLALFLFLVLLGIVASIVFKTQSKPAFTVTTPQQTIPEHVDIALKNARFTEMRNAVIIWELTSASALYSKAGDQVTLQGITMIFAATGQAGKCTVTAREGTYSNSSKNITLRGNVHIETENGARFDTDAVAYDAKRGLFTSRNDIRFSHDRLTLTAQGMELAVQKQKARFFSPVDAVIAGNK